MPDTKKAHKKQRKMWAKLACQIAGDLQSPAFLSHDPLDYAALVLKDVLNRRLLIQKARDHNWGQAYQQLVMRSRQDLTHLHRSLPNIISGYESVTSPRKTAVTAHDIYADLESLEKEFPAVRYDKVFNTLSVTTDPVSLYDPKSESTYDLGDFEIRLHLRSFESDVPNPDYAVIACNPQPASRDENVTHPHVQNDSLCEGEGRMMIRSAISTGWVYDFFVIVRQVLESYNPDGPYIALHEWEQDCCPDCGDSMEEPISCVACDNAICPGCAGLCGDCRESFCFNCLPPCQHCGEHSCSGCSGCSASCGVCSRHTCEYCTEECVVCAGPACPKCRETCEECGESYCDSCIPDEESGDGRLLCPVCLKDEKEKENAEKEQDRETSDTAQEREKEPEPASDELTTTTVADRIREALHKFT